MNKQYKVTVNGKVFDVNVEEVGEGAVVQSAPAPVVEQPVVVEQPKQPEIVASQPVGGNVTQITSPMPGNIWKIKTSVGASVKKHEVLLILEAMKMENEIVAPEDGTVTAILVKEGDSVEPGKIMVELA